MELRRAHKRQRSQSPASPPQHQQPATATSDPSPTWLPDIAVQRVADLLTSNEVACALRLVNKATAAQLSAPQHTTVRLSQPVPHHAFARRWASPDALRTLTREQRRELPCLTARSGSIADLEVLLARDDLPRVLDDDVLEAAAAAGQLDVCVWLKQRGCPFKAGLLAEAAKGGHQAVCEWLLANGCTKIDDDWGSVAGAAKGGHVGLMDWLLLRADTTEVDELLEAAAEGCDLPTLQRLHHIHVDSCSHMGLPSPYTSSVLSAAAAGSRTEDWQAKMEWLEARGYPRTEESCGAAAGMPDALPRLQWLRQRGYPLGNGVAASAAGAGNLAALQYVLDQGVEVHVDMMRYAAEGGHVAVMEVLHARGAPMDEEMVRTAAAAGHLTAVAWLVERLGAAAALTTHVFAAAAKAASMELLGWLRARGCPWDVKVFVAAAEQGSEEQLEWLADQGCPVDWDVVEAAAARHYDGELVGWLQAQRKQRAPAAV
ncbi:Ankyrin repeat domain-containing protein [Tetrabaena socialis]|uniref:Ankyrin repeat domain-containing protein n=1 Tax=Tetrabaena socialis TaxID=47790 RepID=A0A2J8AFP5_9CHLO|nr:Ankyrin repeat domain-containing protein [Tetrabaena socialis]|eukprot:PNH11339.1 Ankyrin repeat domain-containing protein [Tetrabaena socialis]